MAQGPQKSDHGGKFIMVPRRVVDSVAWRNASMRARAVLQVLQYCHDGYNNGTLAISIKQIGQALGDQNHGANSRALAELIELGFLECTSDAAHGQAKARTYRITFISTGEGKRAAPATHEYADWRPTGDAKKAFGGARTAARKKFGAAVTTTQEVETVIVTATQVKFHGAETATRVAVTPGVSADRSVAVTAPHLGNHPGGNSGLPEISSHPCRQSIVAPLDELRAWVRAAVEAIGYGGAKALASAADIPEPTLSRFRQGRSLPEQYQRPLHEACARVLPYSQFRAAA